MPHPAPISITVPQEIDRLFPNDLAAFAAAIAAPSDMRV
jgi:hypothetical protein